jgi:7,8-dihydropterin-6-yl-methyl-4-(beta-D-ribofuranosyl)aminobenzene 5'-phosphate synthase
MTEFGETSNVAITFLIENRTDMLVKSTDTVKYYADRPLIAEHGFSALVELKTQGLKILWDTGATRHAALENMRRMQIDPTTINVIALSHGHGDHTTGLAEILRAMDVRPKPRRWEPTASQEEMLRHARGQQVPIVAHPAAFRERWETPSDGTRYGPIAAPPKEEWEAAGGQVVFSKEPYVLAPGCQTTGPIPRTSFETAGVSSSMSYREGAAFVRDYTEDDQALIINVQGKGLVILSGCAHSGVVNTVNYARAKCGPSLEDSILPKRTSQRSNARLTRLSGSSPRW